MITLLSGQIQPGTADITIMADGYARETLSQSITEVADTTHEWELVGSANFSADSVNEPTVTVDTYGIPHVAYIDGFDNKDNAAVMRYNGGEWVSVGSPDSVSAGEVNYLSMKMDMEGTLYVAYDDRDNDGKATVMKYNGNHWLPVGTGVISTSEADDVVLSFDTEGTPYVAYRDGDQSDNTGSDGKSTVMKYTGSEWAAVGSAGFSVGEVSDISLAVDTEGNPYIAYEDDRDAAVMKFNGTHWIAVGNISSQLGSIDEITMVLHNDTPYVAYQDDDTDKAAIVKYEGENWVSVGPAGISMMDADNINLVTDNGTLYVAYTDIAYGDQDEYGRSVVKKYDGTQWATVGSLGFSLVGVDSQSLYVHNGVPYVVYTDIDTYEATVMRAVSTNNNLNAIGLSSGTLSPSFDAETTTYTASVPDASITVTPTTANANATVTVSVYGESASPVISGQASDPLDLNIGANTITVTVTAQNGEAKIYTITVTRLNNNAALSDLILSNGTLSPAFAAETNEYMASVPNSVSSLTVTATSDDSNADITVNGMVVHSDTASDVIHLNVGSNSIPIVVTAQDGTTNQSYTITVTRAAPPSNEDDDDDNGSDNSGDNGDEPGDDSGDDSGEDVGNEPTGQTVQQDFGTVTSTDQDGQTVLTATVDSEKLIEQLNDAGDRPVIVIPIKETADKVTTTLTGNTIKELENKQGILAIQTTNGNYRLPAAEVFIDQLSEELGVGSEFDDITVHIDIAKSNNTQVEVLANAANTGGFTVVVPPVDFTVTATRGNSSVNVTKFTSYVEREIPIPASVDSSTISTVIVLNDDGTIRSVPTKIIVRDGQTYVVINSLTNSTYAVISNPTIFTDVENHWAKDIVNDMGSRLIINGTGSGQFSPERGITRAEFAAIVVRGLGLKLEKGQTTFADVDSLSWYNDEIKTAYEHSLINGFEDGTFRPNDKITREEAMVIVSKAMMITDLSSQLSNSSIVSILQSYNDVSEISTWALQGFSNAVEVGIVFGKSSTELAPQDNISRAEVAVIIERLLRLSDLI